MARKSRKNIASMAADALTSGKAWNVGAYVRLSAVDKKHKGDSIENQQAIIAAYCGEHPKLVIREVYIDDGVSGQKLDRPAFQKMLADMENGLIDCCIAKDLSRYGRSAIDTGYYIEKYFPTRNIRCIAINDNYDSADDQSGGMMISLKNLVNENYALEIGRKIHTTKQMNIRNGCFVGSRPPYGYLKSKDDPHKLVPDPIAAPIVARAFAMAASGASATEIRDWLNGAGILPPTRHLYSIGAAGIKEPQGHAHWNIGVVYAMLKNRVYVGDMVQGKGRTQSYDVTRVNPSDWIVTKNTHEAIVSRELFEDVRRLRGGAGRPESSLGENIFHRKIFCGHCGFAMHRRKTGKESVTYLCNTRHSHGKDDCVPNSIGEDTLQAIVLESLRKKAVGSRKQLNLPRSARALRESTELVGIHAELTRISGFLKGLYESHINGDLTVREYKEMKHDYESRIAALTERDHALTNAIRERNSRQITLDKANDSLEEADLPGGLTAEIVDALIVKILVFHDLRVEIHFKFTEEVSVEGGVNHGE